MLWMPHKKCPINKQTVAPHIRLYLMWCGFVWVYKKYLSEDNWHIFYGEIPEAIRQHIFRSMAWQQDILNAKNKWHYVFASTRINWHSPCACNLIFHSPTAQRCNFSDVEGEIRFVVWLSYWASLQVHLNVEFFAATASCLRVSMVEVES